MKVRGVSLLVVLGMFFFVSALLPAVPAAGDDPKPAKFKQEELDQMIAPIALYPDSLLAQVLMASTYPLEVVEADRWAKQNKNLKGDALTAAVSKQQWDPSIKSLVPFPQVLSMMSDKLEWTQKLGDAFLAQQKDVMATVQKLRAKAHAQGTLTTTPQQKVVVQDQIIEIVPASPTVVYVPAYDPAVVYGAWWYPAYPPYPVYPPGAMVATSMVSFGVGMAVGAAWSNNCGSWNWGHGDLYVNANKTVNVNTTNVQNTNVNKANVNKNTWQHDPDHRKGVAYPNNTVAKQYGQAPRDGAQTRQGYRGYNGGANKGADAGRPTGAGQQQAGSMGKGGQQQAGQSAKSSGLGQASSHQQSHSGLFDGADRGGHEAAATGDRGRQSFASQKGGSGFGGSGFAGRSFGGRRR